MSGCGDRNDGPVGGNGGSSGSGGSSAGSAGTGGAATASGGSAGSGGMAPVCNELSLDAAAVGFTYDAGSPPDATGGEIADGTYFLTAQVVYDTASGLTIPLGRTKVVIAGSIWQEVTGDPMPDRCPQ